MRVLRRAPLFSTVAIVTLTLAIGANTAVFSILNVLVLRSLPVRDPGALVQFSWLYPRDPPQNVFSVVNYELFRDHNSVLSDLIGLARFAPEARSGDEPVVGAVVTGNFFAALGVGSSRGRVLEAADDTPSAAPVAVLSDGYWKRRFNADPRAVGAAITIQDPRIPVPVQATIVGVAQPAFSGVTAGYRPDIWVSLASLPAGVRARVGLALMARLKPGVSIRQAQDQMRALDRPRIAAFAARDPQWLTVTLDVKPAAAGLATPLHDQFERPVLVLMLLLAIMLFLACANIGSLLLARGAARQREMAVRISLGAGRLRIARQVLTESLLLAAAGSAAGVVAAPPVAVGLVRLMAAGARSLRAVPPPDIPLDVHVLLLAIAVSVGSTILFGAIPAAAAYVSAPRRVLTETDGGTPSPIRRRAGGALVTAQVALCFTLLTVSWLYAAHLAELRDRSLGFDRTSTLLVSLDLSGSGGSRERQRQSSRALLARFEQLPGVRSATVSGMTPISGAAGSRFITVPGFDEPLQARSRVCLNDVGPDYFTTYRTPVLEGRDFQAQDEHGPLVAIVNQALARHYFAAVDPVGRDIAVEGIARPYRIVGVVADAKYQDVRVAAPATMYFSALQGANPAGEFTLRTSVPPASLAPAIQRIVADELKGVRIRKLTTLSDQVDAAIVPERLLALLSGFFGGLGTLLAATGLYGLVAYTITRRTREIGIRIALGATRVDIMRMVLIDALRLVALGLLMGAPAALWGQRVAATMLDNMPAGGWWPMLAASAATIVIALGAAGIPTRRAMRIAPVIALRTD